MDLHIDDVPGWRCQRFGDLIVHYAGDAGEVRALAEVLERFDATSGLQQIIEFLLKRFGHFGAIVRGPNFIFACADRIRSYPIFYTAETISNSARQLSSTLAKERLNEAAQLEASMTGYVTGKETLREGLWQLKAGEFLTSNLGKAGGSVYQYYRYVPKPISGRNQGELFDELGIIVDNVFTRVIEKAGGRPIILPLSGGLDSRLIACKLHELGYERIQAITYGPAGNDEAFVARQVAQALNLDWKFVPWKKHRSRKLFHSSLRKRYWETGGGLCALPTMREFQAFSHLKEVGVFLEDTVIITGQSGDFIAGEHIPEQLHANKDISSNDVVDAIINRHYSLWPELQTCDNLSFMKNRIKELLPEPSNLNTHEAAMAAYESWEYHERQAKYVVNDMRLYDFLGLSWQLPLWDGEFVDFWQGVEFDQKINRKLFRDYVRNYNYRGLFPETEPHIWRWSSHMKWVIPLARAIGLIMGHGAKESFYGRMRYFGYYGPLYAMFGFVSFQRVSPRIRNAESLLARAWLEECDDLDPSTSAFGSVIADRKI